MTGRLIVSTTAGCLLAFAAIGMAAPDEAQPASLLQFKEAIHQYVQLHRRIERQLPPFRPHSDTENIIESSNAMAGALHTARVNAREGDIFTPEMAALLRTRVSDALAARGFTAESMVAAMLEEADTDAPLPLVNGRFPWRRGAAMWPCVLDALPKLPDELQYRFVGRDLVLVDTHADLVVDILRNAVR
ncbi:MAG TPA: hypothetical protein VJM31_01605 [Vicinamibacterales bacterium]|nr:hypothetical protein [Vicinamibacterales bacterium]